MIKFCLLRWDENNKKLREVIANTPSKERKNWGYEDLVYLVATTVFEFELSDIRSIVFGGDCNYSGTLVFLIPTDECPETEREWLMSYIGYGSCTVCDTLQHIQCDDDESDSDIDVVNEYMNLCRDIVSNTILPYNNGWRRDDLYDTVTVDDTDVKDNDARRDVLRTKVMLDERTSTAINNLAEEDIVAKLKEVQSNSEEENNTDADGTHISSMIEEFADKFGHKIPKDHFDEPDMWDVNFITFDNYREFVLKPTIQALQSATAANISQEEKDRIDNLIVDILNQWNDASQAYRKHENVDENAKKLYKLMNRISNALRRSQKDPLSNMVPEFSREFDEEEAYWFAVTCAKLDEIEKSCIDPMIKELQGDIACISDFDVKAILNSRIDRITTMWADIKKEVLSHKIPIGDIKSMVALYTVMRGR